MRDRGEESEDFIKHTHKKKYLKEYEEKTAN